ncbi:Do family serine endopeptidase [candidate division KSB1 bacterium]|nr:Do family serine endopeptidase [candidate division KSB1 bacterium]
MKMKNGKWMPVTGFILIGVAIGIIFASNMNWPPKSIAAKLESPASSAVIPASEPSDAVLQLQNTSRAFVEITKEVMPAVVTITATKYVTRSTSSSPFSPFFEEWFGRRPPGDRNDNRKEEKIPQGGMGSGFIISEDGYILTNNHVVGEADELLVELPDKRQFEAKIVGTDPLTDVAVIKIDGDNLPVARLGNSESIEIGEWVLAMGNPLGLSSTVTAGIVSALNRNIHIIEDKEASRSRGSYALENFIQTDAAINRGNSGGPLVDLSGQVIGINTAIASGTGFYAGYGFAIPMNLAKKVMNDLITQGFVTRAYLGIGMLEVSENEAEYYGLNNVRGARIDQVIEDGPAEKAGLKKLDIILKVDSKEITEPSDVQSYIAMKTPGDEVSITVLRDKKEKVIKAKLGKRDTGKQDVQVAESDKDDALPDLGIEVKNLTGEIRSQLDSYENDEGVVVMNVDRYSAGADARIVRGDLVTQIEDIPIRNVSDYRKALRSFKNGDVVLFHLKRRDTDTAAFVKLPK